MAQGTVVGAATQPALPGAQRTASAKTGRRRTFQLLLPPLLLAGVMCAAIQPASGVHMATIRLIMEQV